MDDGAHSQAAVADGQAIIGTILAVLRERTGYDFSRYRPATVERRIHNRMIAAGIDSPAKYLALLESTPEETFRLIERLTIKVSRFYRNSGTFDVLRQELIPYLAGARGEMSIRIWSAGCACGEEAYTLAMLLEEAGHAGFVEATDIDPSALGAAHVGFYSEEAVAELPPDLLDRYLERASQGRRAGYRVRDALRQRVRFSRHDLMSQVSVADGACFDLVCCRNTLIYLQRDVQERVLGALRRALAPGGFLCLGEAEWPGAAARPSLEPFRHQARIFRAAGRPPGGDA